jgi:hypothetical protein
VFAAPPAVVDKTHGYRVGDEEPAEVLEKDWHGEE